MRVSEIINIIKMYKNTDDKEIDCRIPMFLEQYKIDYMELHRQSKGDIDFAVEDVS